MSTIRPDLEKAIWAATAWHEVGGKESVARKPSFARLASSGLSFGYMQNDCHADPPALAQLIRILNASKIIAPAYLGAAMPHGWPGPVTLLGEIDTALLTDQGRALTDELDQRTFQTVLHNVGLCATSAAAGGRVLGDDAAIACAIYTNQFGSPTTVLLWLSGAAVMLNGAVVAAPPIHATITAEMLINRYIDHIRYEEEHTFELDRLREAVAVGMASLGAGAAGPAPTAAPDPAADADSKADELNEAELKRVEDGQQNN